MSNDKSYTIAAQTVKCAPSVQGVAAIADEATKVDLNDFNGGRSTSWRDENGLIHVLLSDSLLRGKRNEPSVRDVLGQRVTGTIEKGEDGRGEDGRLRTPEGDLLTNQIVTVPPEVELIGKSEQAKRWCEF